MKIYTIVQGSHSSGAHFKPHFKPHFNTKYLSHTIEFDRTAHYYFGSDDQNDINKLFGISFGYHHYNSVRFGWRTMKPYTNQVEILAYIYVNGKRIHENNKNLTIGYVNINESYLYKMMFDDSKVSMYVMSFDGAQIDNKVFDISRSRCKLGYHLFPYFGGNQVAPHDINIKFND